jgi:hypothetical protein
MDKLLLSVEYNFCVGMERRLVMYQLLDTNLTNEDMLRKLRQDLGYDRFRRVKSKNGNSIFYLFYQRELETYKALRAAKKMKTISLVRYKNRNGVLPPPAHLDEFPCEELPFHPGHSQKVSNYLRYSFTKYFEKFSSRVRHRDFFYIHSKFFSYSNYLNYSFTVSRLK